ncbi:hypothetical protein [Nocardia sp. NPDC052112]|uniref:hypothetical protein n=1 Tax=Nocardia sp. NPDC052112 TaxID=3155646 RepID=UPI00344AAC12
MPRHIRLAMGAMRPTLRGRIAVREFSVDPWPGCPVLPVIYDHLDDIDDKVATSTRTGGESVAAQVYSEARQQRATVSYEFAEGAQASECACGAAGIVIRARSRC